VIDHGHSLDTLPWVAAAVSVVALLLTWLASRMDRPVPQPVNRRDVDVRERA
jgi:DHA1 family inner membrane transport protein